MRSGSIFPPEPVAGGSQLHVAFRSSELHGLAPCGHLATAEGRVVQCMAKQLFSSNAINDTDDVRKAEGTSGASSTARAADLKAGSCSPSSF